VTEGGKTGPGPWSGLSIRPARGSDLSAVLELWRVATLPSHTDDLGSLRRLLACDDGALLVAECAGALVGSVIAAWDGWRGTIHRLAVVPSHRGRGLGRLLLNAGVERLYALGTVRMQAIVIETDATAMGFWRASDWDEQTERIRFTKG
jgi:ribosomal protein S18 acetylase RimI-like enzyme